MMFALVIATPSRAQQSPETVVSGLRFPAGIAFLPDGRMLVTERVGTVRIVENGRLLPEPLVTFETTTAGETGALGIAVPGDFARDSAAYVFVTEADGSSNSVWRVPLDGAPPQRVIEGIPAAGIHNGGGVVFGIDGKLYVSNGEQGDAPRAANPEVLGGKVYRFERDGSIPPDNPFDNPVYAYGLRNPYGIAVDPVNGNVWVTENGPSEFDELNRIEPERDHGWPEVSGPGCDGSCVDPVLAYRSIVVPTGITFAPAKHRSDAAGDLFFATYGEGSVHQVGLNEARTEAVSDRVIVRDDRIVALTWGPGGLYYGTESSVKKITFTGTGEASAGASIAPSPAIASSPGPADARDEGGGSSPLAIVVALVLLGAVTLMRSRMNRDTAAFEGSVSGEDRD